MVLDLERQLRFYGAYHNNSANVAIHIVCVPLLLATALLLATNLKFDIPLLDNDTLPPSLGAATAIGYSLLYMLMEPVAGFFFSVFVLGSAVWSHQLLGTFGWQANQAAIAVHVVCWLAQFVGHGAFEGRAPALLDNLVQALFLAPFFVWFEILFFFGYRHDLHARVKAAVESDIAKFHKERAEKAQ